MSKVHIKGRILQIVEEGGPCWDYEVAARVIEEYGLRDQRYFKGMVRLTLIELASSGLVTSVEESLDDGARFGKGKLLCRYAITDFGRSRMKDTGLLHEGRQRHV